MIDSNKVETCILELNFALASDIILEYSKSVNLISTKHSDVLAKFALSLRLDMLSDEFLSIKSEHDLRCELELKKNNKNKFLSGINDFLNWFGEHSIQMSTQDFIAEIESKKISFCNFIDEILLSALSEDFELSCFKINAGDYCDFVNRIGDGNDLKNKYMKVELLDSQINDIELELQKDIYFYPSIILTKVDFYTSERKKNALKVINFNQNS